MKDIGLVELVMGDLKFCRKLCASAQLSVTWRSYTFDHFNASYSDKGDTPGLPIHTACSQTTQAKCARDSHRRAWDRAANALRLRSINPPRFLFLFSRSMICNWEKMDGLWTGYPIPSTLFELNSLMSRTSLFISQIQQLEGQLQAKLQQKSLTPSWPWQFHQK